MLYFAKWKTGLIALVVAWGVLFTIPNFLSQKTLEGFPSWLPSQQINLGLDLQGGVHLAFQVEFEELMEERLNVVKNDIRKVLRGNRENRIQYEGLRTTGKDIQVIVKDQGDVTEAVRRIRELANTVGNVGMGFTNTQDIAVASNDAGRITVTMTEPALIEMRDDAMARSIEIIRRRIDELGTKEPSIQREGEGRIIVQVPGEDNPQRIIDIVGKTAKMNFLAHDPSVTIDEALSGRIPPGSRLYEYDESARFPGEQILLKEVPIVSGERLTAAFPTFDQNQRPAVGFQFDTAGGRAFGRHTRDHVGEIFAITLDDKVITAPSIIEPILSGDGQITGNFTVQSATDLAILISAGALPAPLTPVEQRTVGAELGQDSIEAGEMAAVIGFVAVIVFMVLSYGLFGIFANISLIVNMVLIAGALSMMQSTLTLPGIAGIVLTIGMAVDANVLIFERIREEIAAGKTPLSAVEAGYQRAFGTIADANITTFIAAFILFYLGSGPVRGFAVTLAIGILTSVFTAFILTRLLTATWLKASKPKRLPI